MSELVAQLIWNGLVTGALIALVALGLTLIYGVAGFIQFAHGEMVALGAYAFMIFHKLLHWEILPAALAAVTVGVVVGLIIEKLFFRPVREHDPMIPLVLSIGLSIGLQALILIFFGPNILTISDRSFHSLSIFGKKILATPSQIWAIFLSFVLMGGLILFLKKTKIGKYLRAVASNRSVAEVFGMSTDHAMQWIFGIGVGLAVIAGIFLGFEQNLEPLMGVHMSVKAFSAVVLGAVGSVRGAILGAFLIGLAESLLVGLSIIPSGFSAAIPFVILIGMLLVRPEGLFGRRFENLRR
ncbi:branched-chain amino acid ABC transporter permease [Candidatus Gracilibacteria bacterium]|nr:branched-chain amino acid ABC transporter permease [Candidatus Gracilibacteria bacterium]